MSENVAIKNIKEETTLPVVSYSKVTTYKDCPKRYKFAYIDKLPRLENPATIFGSFNHDILENFHAFYIDPDHYGVMRNREVSIFETMTRCFNEALEKWSGKITKDQVKEAQAIMTLYLDKLEDNEKDLAAVVSVEKKIWLPIDNKFVLLGYIDRIQQDDDMLHIADYKTTKDEKYLKDRTQLLLYGYSEAKNDPSIKKLRTSYILLKHKLKLLIETHTLEDLEAAKDKFVNDWEKIQEDKIFRAAVSFKCRWCDFQEHCRDYQRKINKSKTSGKISW